MPRELTAIGRRLRRALVAAVLVVLVQLVLPCTAHAACTISTTGVNFGTYNVYAGTPNDSTGTVTYRCGTADRNITITLSEGGSGTYAGRTMNQGGGGSDTLAYNLYFNAARTSIWGDGTGGTTYYSRNNPPNNQDVVLTVYGRIPASQDVGVGSYTDTIVATVNF